ncbi:hypothetical protein V6N12_012942 [Hibiscus sabdariffa]|uniref:CCHC-type domain-containing protein n=1 Tax=Hibiscus sabdariffa TaxID=183260 RepID=A0ABR2EFX2_9ROSI
MTIHIDLNKPLVSKLLVNGRIKVVEYESLPTIRFVCGKYGHVSDSCPMNFPDAERVATPPPNATQSHGSCTDAFGPWMIVEKCQQIVNREGLAHDGETVIRAVSLQHKGKAVFVTKKPRVVHVWKPITVTFNDFPIVPKFVTKASSSRSPKLGNNAAKLDKTRHSSIVVSENLDPNLQDPIMAPHVTPTCNNSLTLGKPPDPRTTLIASSDVNDMCEKQATQVLNADSLLEAHVTDMLE